MDKMCGSRDSITEAIMEALQKHIINKDVKITFKGLDLSYN